MVALLADAYPDQRLAPSLSSLCERADYLQMLHFGASSMDMMLWQIEIHEDMLSEAERDARYDLSWESTNRDVGIQTSTWGATASSWREKSEKPGWFQSGLSR